MQQIPKEDCMYVHGQYVKELSGDPKHDTLHVPMKIAEQLGGLNYNLPKRIESSSSDNYESLCTRYNALRNDLDHFWNIWQKDYLAALADREATRSRNGRGTIVPPRVGDILIIREQDVPRSTWFLGLILQLHTSSDGQVRLARIRTGKRHILDRTINHLVPHEISAKHVEDIQTSKQQRQATRKRQSRKVKAEH
ncbi:unnamed protein product [Cylicocyclus nassatus]|uniref:DUF5641 domain-containing protein n=1 Tax=Cylicocyclus nassatus TaxID=53992 RepID=A0AA36GFE0_CYLNA|nr:unnamed protein product [Cylicocyclus nassatus]